MADVFFWWAAVEVIGLISFPIAFAFFHRLPDRGYTFSKVLGLLLLGYLLWIGATIGVISYDRGAALLILLGLGLAAVVIWGQKRDEIGRLLRERWRYILFVEALFAVSFITAVWLRSFVPDLVGTEKPYEFAYLNAILRSEQFPPHDPWLAPFSLSYYYFGLVIMGALVKITGVAASVGFNIALGLVTALTVVMAFGVVYNLVAAVGRVRHAIAFGLVGVLLVVILGNLEGVFELMAAHRVGPSALYTWVGVDGLNLQDAGGTSEWYPNKFFWWWKSTRIPSNWDIKEYPFFSFLLGDLHPHVMVMPFSLLGLGTAFNLLRTDSILDGRWGLRNPLAYLLIMVIIGGLSFLNAWSLPSTLALLTLAVFARNWWQRERAPKPALLDTISFVLPLTLGAVLLYLPFYWTSSGALWGIAPVEVLVRPPHLPLAHMVTLPKHLFISWGPLLWLVMGLSVAGLSWRWLARLGWKSWWALLPGMLPLLAWVVIVLGHLGFSGFIDELQMRGSNLLTLALLVGLIAVMTLAFVRALGREDGTSDSLLLTLAAVGISIVVILGTELFFQLDHLNGSRENTVFKLWHHSWLFLGVGGAFGLYHVLSSRPDPRDGPPRMIIALPKLSWTAVATVLILASLVLPLAATFARTNGFTAPRSLDGLSFANRFNPQEMEAVVWLNENVAGAPVILEAVGDPFTEGGRISSRTGLPTVLEWPYHQVGNRGGPEILGNRRQEVEMVYKTGSTEEALAIMDKYDVEYVIVGSFEKREYGEDGLAKFKQFMETAFQNDAVIIYRLPRPITEVGVSLAYP